MRAAIRRAACSCQDTPCLPRLRSRSWGDDPGRAKPFPCSCTDVPAPTKRSRCRTPDIPGASQPFPRPSLDVRGGAPPFPPPILDIPTGAKLSPRRTSDVTAGAQNCPSRPYTRETAPFYARSGSWLRPPSPNVPTKPQRKRGEGKSRGFYFLLPTFFRSLPAEVRKNLQIFSGFTG